MRVGRSILANSISSRLMTARHLFAFTRENGARGVCGGGDCWRKACQDRQKAFCDEISREMGRLGKADMGARGQPGQLPEQNQCVSR